MLPLAKYTKHESFFDILMTITLGVNMMNKKMNPFFFSSTLQALSIGIFNFSFQDLQNSVPPLHFVLFCKIHIYVPKMTLLILLTWISFLYIKFANFWYIIFSVPNLIPICHWRLSNQKSNKFVYLIRKTKLISNIYNTSNHKSECSV